MQSRPFDGLVTLLVFSLSLVVALTFHEYSHALTATLQGDPTARGLGRLSLNPLAHLDPLGTAMIVFAGFGWARPVPVNPANLQSGPRPGMALVALAGPISNLLMATLAALPFRAGVVSSVTAGIFVSRGGSDDLAGYVVGSIVFWNLVIGAFNLIPIAPLDGFKVALGVLPREASYQFAQLERYGPGILLTVIAIGYLLPGAGILSSVILPIVDTLSGVVLGGHV